MEAAISEAGKTALEKQRLLKEVFGHKSFRSGQEEAIDCLLSGRDIMTVMPTGAGKSVCYQLPALMMSGITLVVSPLISLMKDQAMALTQNGVAAAFINSSQSIEDYIFTMRLAERGDFKILYVAPERLESESFFALAQKVKISMVIVDEAHCVSQWGQDFRPSYLGIAEFIERLPERPVVGAFTATATDRVREDIKEKLRLCRPMETVTGFDRPNLFFKVIRATPKEKANILQTLLEEYNGRSGIIYCSTRKITEQVYEACRELGCEAAMYHAGMSDEARKQSQEDFIYDRARVMVATNAFGMGIDKSNVGFVIHYNMPKSPEAYYQEAGRAGRDGSAADCILLYSGGDLHTALYFIDNMEGEGLSRAELAEVKKQEKRRLNAMVDYCTTDKCLREFLLNYFGEKCSRCSGCGNCQGEFREADITDPAQRIISCVFRIQQRGHCFGAAAVSDILKGKATQKLLDRRLNTLSTFGIMSDYKKSRIGQLIDTLVQNGYLSRTDDEYRLLSVTEKGDAAVKNREKITERIL
ncbi:MAG: RecQ family ATP-dependent DNA helicase, partial [Firmicutes bacterium]|nr:RecQ family ATP-dependent DNA helicase [Bacillota bacterium]